jgi:hypothetical protein
LTTTLKLPFEALVLLGLPSNAGQGAQITELGKDLRFEQRPGEIFGRLMERDKGTGQWTVTQDNLLKVETATGFAILSNEDRKRLSEAVSYPISNPQSSGSAPLTPPLVQNDPNTTYPASTPIASTTVGTPIPRQLTVEDLIVEARASAEQRRFRDGLIEEAKRLNPNFDPKGYEAHHVFKLVGGSPDMQRVRAELQKLGLDLNDLANGVLLPGSNAPDNAQGAYHPRLDNDVYNNRVTAELEGVTSAEQARGILRDIGNRLRANDYPGIRPRSGQ